MLGAVVSAPATANDVYNLNQTGFTLPGVSLPQGQDEVRAADGTTCRSSISGSGAYLDLGVVGGRSATEGMATYGRVVVPLGRRQTRINCARLYALEIQRLEMEIRMLKMGIAEGSTQQVQSDWANEGWSSGRDK
ncbi:MAG: hypothetical protein JJ864_03320 [Rhizobiaceae bacterium]|nr:hypothetical protein [Rhizobiaceae bacterium]